MKQSSLNKVARFIRKSAESLLSAIELLSQEIKPTKSQKQRIKTQKKRG
jgi:hypothetical protein